MRKFTAAALCSVGLLPGCFATPSQPALDREGPPPLHLALDTLNVEVQNLWVRISAASTDVEDVTLQWELEAETENPYWRPKTIRRVGGQSFDGPGEAEIWGNVPRAYDFRLVVSGITAAGTTATDTLNVLAPLCRDPKRPGLICNPAAGTRRDRDRRGTGR